MVAAVEAEDLRRSRQYTYRATRPASARIQHVPGAVDVDRERPAPASRGVVRPARPSCAMPSQIDAPVRSTVTGSRRSSPSTMSKHPRHRGRRHGNPRSSVDGRRKRTMSGRASPARPDRVRVVADARLGADAHRWSRARRRAASTSAVVAGCSAESRTSRTSSTRWNVITSRTASGTSSRSGPLRLGRITVVEAGTLRGEHLLLHATDRQHPALQRDLAGHADVGCAPDAR